MEKARGVVHNTTAPSPWTFASAHAQTAPSVTSSILRGCVVPCVSRYRRGAIFAPMRPSGSPLRWRSRARVLAHGEVSVSPTGVWVSEPPTLPLKEGRSLSSIFGGTEVSDASAPRPEPARRSAAWPRALWAVVAGLAVVVPLSLSLSLSRFLSLSVSLLLFILLCFSFFSSCFSLRHRPLHVSCLSILLLSYCSSCFFSSSSFSHHCVLLVRLLIVLLLSLWFAPFLPATAQPPCQLIFMFLLLVLSTLVVLFMYLIELIELVSLVLLTLLILHILRMLLRSVFLRAAESFLLLLVLPCAPSPCLNPICCPTCPCALLRSPVFFREPPAPVEHTFELCLWRRCRLGSRPLGGGRCRRGSSSPRRGPLVRSLASGCARSRGWLATASAFAREARRAGCCRVPHRAPPLACRLRARLAGAPLATPSRALASPEGLGLGALLGRSSRAPLGRPLGRPSASPCASGGRRLALAVGLAGGLAGAAWARGGAGGRAGGLGALGPAGGLAGGQGGRAGGARASLGHHRRPLLAPRALPREKQSLCQGRVQLSLLAALPSRVSPHRPPDSRPCWISPRP